MGAGLTPAAHARIRLQLALIPAYVWLVVGWRDLLSHFPIGRWSQPSLARDFITIYLQAVIAHQGDRQALYDLHRRAVIVSQVVPNPPNVIYPPFYPPQLAVLFSPLGRLPYADAMALWMLISFIAYMACGYVVWRACKALRDRPGTIALLLLGDPSLYFILSFAQMSALALVCVTGAYVALRAGRPLLAGVFIGSLIYKPSIGLAFPFVLIGAREWRIVLGAIAGAAGQMLAGALYWGPSVLVDFVRAQFLLIPEMRDEFAMYHLHSWRGFFELLRLPPGVVGIAYVIVAGLLFVAAVRCWRSGGPLEARFAVLVLVSVLVNPHMYVYDIVIMMPALLLLWNWAETFRGRTVGDLLPLAPFEWLRRQSFPTAVAWLLYFCYFSPRFALFAVITHVQLSVPALTLLSLIVVSTTLVAGRRAPETASHY